MSCLFSVGFESHIAHDTLLKDILIAASFRALDTLAHEYAKEAAAEAREYRLIADWYTAVDKENTPDLDISFEIYNALESGLGTVVDYINQEPSVRSFQVFFYDLGTREFVKREDEPFHRIRECLLENYEFGSPSCSVYHRFIR